MRKIPPIKALKELLIDKKRSVSGMNKLEVNLSIYITKLFLYTGLKPMQIMFMWFILQIVSCFIVTKGGYFNILIGVLVYQLSAILDNVDGQVARFYGNESTLALYIDQIYHWINYPLLFLALGYAAGFFWLGIANAVVFIYNKLFVFNPSIYNLRNERVENVLRKIYWSRKKEEKKTIIFKIYEFFRMSLLFNALFLGVLLNQVKITLYVYLTLFIVDFFRKFIYTIQEFRKIDKELYGDKKA